MKKNCLNCKKETDFRDLPLELIGDEILCRDCAGEIVYKVKEIYKGMPEEKFKQLKDEIIADGKTHMSEATLNVLADTLNYKYYGTIDESEIAQHINDAKITGVSSEAKDNSAGVFGNIGGKIKTLAKVLTWIGIISSVITGISMLATGDEALVLIGILIAAFGSIVSWVSSFLLYGFGQLIENTDELVKNSKKQ